MKTWKEFQSQSAFRPPGGAFALDQDGRRNNNHIGSKKSLMETIPKLEAFATMPNDQYRFVFFSLSFPVL